ncbi:MAG TPA: hypothetical protein VMT61_01460 [Candidatus Binataceae bacterium]|nr:hypothetical protein [Candidatus Binataceae bacterium]
MKTREAAAAEDELLLQLIAAVKTLNVAKEWEAGTTVTLKCPCGKVILPPILLSANLLDRQRGLLKSQIERHLRDRHDVAKQAIHRTVKDAFAAN